MVTTVEIVFVKRLASSVGRASDSSPEGQWFKSAAGQLFAYLVVILVLQSDGSKRSVLMLVFDDFRRPTKTTLLFEGATDRLNPGFHSVVMYN